MNRGVFKIPNGPGVLRILVLDTQENILASQSEDGTIALATDTLYLFYRVNGAWMQSEFPVFAPILNLDIGAMQDSPHLGYGRDYITDKLLANVDIGNSADTSRAGPNRFPIRANNGYLEVYVSGTWQKVVMNFVFAEDPAFGYALVHKPAGLQWWYEVQSGNSIYNLGLNGLPLVQGYVADIGAFPSPQIIGGRPI